MRLKQPYCIWKSHFSEDFCDQVIAHGQGQDLTEASVSYDPAGKARSSSVAWVSDKPEQDWIYSPVASLIAVTNRRFWQWNMSGRESFQYTEYGPNQYYGWHADAREAPYPADGRWGGLTRKISISIILSDPEEYDGGTFALETTGPVPARTDKRIIEMENPLPKGTALIFPSHLHHEVRPVTRGVRRSLVGWFLGPPFV